MTKNYKKKFKIIIKNAKRSEMKCIIYLDPYVIRIVLF